MIDKNSLERIVPEFVEPDEISGAQTLALHTERYVFAAEHVVGSRVCDIACGVGYGTRILAEQHPQVEEAVGIDISPEAIAYAKENYAHKRISFRVEDAMSYSDSSGFDTIVSIETFEHLPDPSAFLKNLLNGLLRPKGRLICSVPVTPSVDANPHHLTDFTEASFRKMFHQYGLREVAHFRQIQPFHPVQVLNKTEKRSRDIRDNLCKYYAKHPRSLLRRVVATLRYGFSNRYLTVVWQLPG